MALLQIFVVAITRSIHWCVDVILTIAAGILGLRFRSPAGTSQTTSTWRSRKQKPLLVIGLVGIIFAVWRIVVFAAALLPKEDPYAYEKLGPACARTTAALLGSTGQVVVITWDTSHTRQPQLDGELASFKLALERIRGIRIRATETLPTVGGSPFSDLTLVKLKEVIDRYPENKVIVSFVGVPQLTGRDIQEWPDLAPKVLTVGGHDPAVCLPKLLASHIVEVAIVPPLDPSGKAVPSKHEWLDEDFQILTAGVKTPAR